MIRKTIYILFSLLFAVFFYITVLFDINDHKDSLEKMISEQANIEFKIIGDLSLDLGVNTKIKAKQLSVKKDNILMLESEEFNASVTVSKILAGRFDINSLNLKNSKLYGINIDESIIKSYNLLAGRNYNIYNNMYISTFNNNTISYISHFIKTRFINYYDFILVILGTLYLNYKILKT